MGRMKHIEVAWTGSLYEPSSDTLLGRLEAMLNESKQDDIILLKVNADVHDYSNSWLLYIKREALWLELVQRLERWYQVLCKISFSKSGWFFLADGDVVGSWWELALSCQGRIFTNPYAKVGFPEAYIDLFPPLGSLAIRKYSVYDNPSNTRSKAILHAKDAHKLGLIDLCLLSDEWARVGGLNGLSAWFESKSNAVDTRRPHLTALVKNYPATPKLEEARRDSTTRRKWLASARVDTAFEICREKNYSAKAYKLASLRAAAATRFLMSDYSAWLSRRVARYRLGFHDKWWSISSDIVAIDISRGLPPHEIVKTFLLRRKRLLFIADKPNRLKDGLETLQTRFDRRDEEGRTALDYWHSAVNWVCSPMNDSSAKIGLVCEFTEDDLVIFQSGALRLTYLRLSGNHSHAGKGWYEDLNEVSTQPEASTQKVSQKDYEEIQETLSLIANGVLKGQLKSTHTDQEACSITIAIRLATLEYLLRLGSKINRCRTFSELLKMLASSGWGFASDIYQWEALLKANKIRILKITPVFDSLLGEAPWLMHGIPSLIDHKFIRTPSTPGIGLKSGAAVTRYVEIFCQCLSGLLYSEKLVPTADEADLFVTLALGYPGVLTLPQGLTETMGDLRISYWQSLLQRTISLEFPRLESAAKTTFSGQ